MALNPQARRAEGVSPLTTSDLEGSRGIDGTSVNLPTSTYRNPGPTPNLRGIEPNTSLTDASNFGEPVITSTFGSEVPRGEVFDAPDSSGMNALDNDADDKVWQASDSSARNSHPIDIPPDAFSAFGESYPGNGGDNGGS